MSIMNRNERRKGLVERKKTTIEEKKPLLRFVRLGPGKNHRAEHCFWKAERGE